MPLHLYDTLRRHAVPFVPADPARVTFYSCGPTVYDDAHIGNFRSFLFSDLLRRYIESPLCTVVDADGTEHTGPREVVHVMNITDVGHMTEDDRADGGGDDKMALAGERLARAQLESKKSGSAHADTAVDPNDPFAIASFYADRFVEDAKRLGLKVAIESEADATLMPRATDHVRSMIRMVEKLIERGHAYAVGEPGAQAVYFAVESWPAYGELSGNRIEALSTGAGGRISSATQSEKRHPADFLLWKSDASHLMKWESPWGVGYPGWHIECSAMSLDRIGAGGMIDLHSGGEDNIFPHHECERAQSCCATGHDTFARHWVHARFLMVEGQKMSKSRGTFFAARDLFAEGIEPAALRLELIRTHYRAQSDFSRQGLKDSQRMVERWRRFIAAGEKSATPGERDTTAAEAFAASMDDDLNIAGAIGAINSWVGRTPEPTKADAALMRTFDDVLGVAGLAGLASAETSIGVFLGGLEPDPAVIDRLEARAAAKMAKDFAAADAIRDELSAMGVAIKDVAGGKVEVSPA